MPTIWLWWLNSGRISVTSVAKPKPTRQGAPSDEITMFAGQISRCSTPRPCMPATALAMPAAKSIRSSSARGLTICARLACPASASTIEAGVMRRIQHLRHTHHAPQPLQDSHLVLQSTLRLCTQRLFADDRAPRKQKRASPVCVDFRAQSRPERADPGQAKPRRHPSTTSHGRTCLYLTPVRAESRRF